MRWLYTLIFFAALPVIVLRLLWRSRRQPAYRQHLAERFGLIDFQADHRPVLWLHAVSVGETNAAKPLVDALLQRRTHRLVLSHTTPTGRARGAELFGDQVEQFTMPYDLPGVWTLWLRRLKPERVLIMETELWPNLMRALRWRRIPAYLINARLSARSYARYARLRRLVAKMLASFAGVAAQHQADADRLRALGASEVQVAGNLKFDLDISARHKQFGKQLRNELGQRRPVVLAASTHPGEDALLLDVFCRLRGRYPEALLLLAPRHPERARDIKGLLWDRKLAWHSRRRDEVPQPGDEVFLIDTLGELGAFFHACDVCLLGGSWATIGGHNMLEPAGAGLPVITGPHLHNFASISEALLEREAMVVAATADELYAQLKQWTEHPEDARAAGRRGEEFVAEHRGVTRKVLAMIDKRCAGDAR